MQGRISRSQFVLLGSGAPNYCVVLHIGVSDVILLLITQIQLHFTFGTERENIKRDTNLDYYSYLITFL